MNLKKYMLVCWLLGSTIASIFLYTCLYDIHRGCDMVSANDEWEHQSMAVNYAEGFGVYKLGAFTKIEKYHIDACDATFPFLRKLFTAYPTEYYHRAAGFSVIVGTLYKLVGTHPFYLRVFNFFLVMCSWLVICYTFYRHNTKQNLSAFLLACLPIYILLNFSYIDLIGDDTLVVFSIALIFYALLRWIKIASYLNTLLLLICFLFAIFIKSTVLFIPFFVLIIAVLYKFKDHVIKALLLNVVLLAIVFFYSNEINKKHQNYKYTDQSSFHKNMLSSNWCKQDSDFINQQHVRYINSADFDFTMYKKVAAYLFERQFYTKKKFLLSGQSLFLLIDGNNEACIRLPEKHIGSWKPYWKFNDKSYFYHFDESKSAYLEIIKFYLHNPILLPIILYIKLYAGYYWNYLFIFLSATQLFLACLIYFKPEKKIKLVLYAISCILLHLLLHLAYMTPLIVALFITTFIFIIKRTGINFRANSIFYTSYFFIFYFLFLTLLMFGLNRYTCIVNGMEIIVLLFICLNITTQIKSIKRN